MAETQGAGEPKLTAPYVTYSAFEEFLRHLKTKGGAPRQVDSTVFPTSMSGGTVSAIRVTLRFFRLAEGTGTTLSSTSLLQEAVSAVGDEVLWPSVAKKLFEQYRRVVPDEIASGGTHRQLEEQLRALGDLKGSGPMKKGVRFFLALASKAAIQLSPHFVGGKTANRSGTTPAKPKKSRKHRAQPLQRDQPASGAGGMPDNVIDYRPLPDSDFRVFLPKSMTEQEFEFAITMLRQYVDLRRTSWQSE